MEHTDLFYRFGAAMAIGFLVGLQREYAHGGPGREIFAGERTLALMGLVGCTAAMAADVLASPWAFVGILVPIGALIVVAYFAAAWRGHVGLTSEVAALVTILTGALCYWGYLALAVAVTVATIVLLSLKMEMDVFVRRITKEDVYATLKFAVITAIVLPILPNQSYGPPPLDVLNPYKIWLMVIFISGISFLGYVLVKVVGSRQGIGLTGLLGGLASSTAVTLTFSQRSQSEPELAKPFALAITVAWTVMFSRVLVVVAALNSALLSTLWQPIVASAVVGLVYCIYLYFSQHTDEEGKVDFSNPFELGPAIQFGLIYAVILLVSKAAHVPAHCWRLHRQHSRRIDGRGRDHALYGRVEQDGRPGPIYSGAGHRTGFDGKHGRQRGHRAVERGRCPAPRVVARFCVDVSCWHRRRVPRLEIGKTTLH